MRRGRLVVAVVDDTMDGDRTAWRCYRSSCGGGVDVGVAT